MGEHDYIVIGGGTAGCVLAGAPHALRYPVTDDLSGRRQEGAA